MSLVETKPSRTAKIVCYMRALGHAEMGAPVANDHLAHHFLSPALRARIRSAEERRKMLIEEGLETNLAYLTARTRHLDGIFQRALTDGTEQIVFLGAGYDTRSYRFDIPTSVRIFEVDAPTTQGAKRKYMAAVGIAELAHVTFVSVDFNRQSLAEELAKAGYAQGKKTLFIWEGVTYYIHAESVDSTLAFIRETARSGSTVAFDYMTDRVPQGIYTDYGAQNSAETVAEAGEPFIFGIPDGAISLFLDERGYEMVQHFTPDQFQETYLDERFSRMYGFFRNAVATVR